MLIDTYDNPMLSYAMAYTSSPLNLRLCKLRPRSKAPMLAEWNRLAIGPADAPLMFTSEYHGIGLVHEASGTGAFDVDSVELSTIAFAEFGIDLVGLLDGYPRIAGRDGRDKIIFRVPPGYATIKLIWPPMGEGLKPSTVFELRSAGGQDVLPPSIHPDTGKPYTWVVDPFGFPDGIPYAPQVLLHIWANWKAFKPQFEQACPWATSKPEEPKPVARMSSRQQGGVIDAFNQAHDVASILEAHNYKQQGKRWLSPTSSSGIPGVVVLKESGRCFSHHASDPLNDGHSHDAFSLFCLFEHGCNMTMAVKDAARILGMDRKRQDVPQIDTTEILKKTPQPNPSTAAPPEKLRTPHHLLTPPGIVGKITAHIIGTSRQPQPELAVAAALVLAGTIMGQKFATSSGLRSNIYMLGIAKTGHGKEHARKVIKEVLISSGLAGFMGGEEIASGQGLVSRVASNPVSLFMMDEFGLFLQSVQKPGAGSHRAEILTNFMKLFSAASSSYLGTEYADQKARPRIDIEHPCVGLYGTTTPETLFPALGSSHIASGYLNRMIVCFSPEDMPVRRRVSWAPVPEEIAGWAKAVRVAEDGLAGVVPNNPIVIGESAQVSSMFDEFQAEIDGRMKIAGFDGTSDIWARAMEHALKIALVCSVSTDPTSRTTCQQSAQWAIEFTRHHLEIMAREVAARVADSDFLRVVLDVLRLIKQAGPRGLTEPEISKGSRFFRSLQPTQRDQVITAICRDESAEWQSIKLMSGKTRSSLVEVATAATDRDKESRDT